MEVLLVLVIVAVLGAMVVPGLFGVQKQSYIDATKGSIKGLEQALKVYRMHHDGEFPTTSEGLEVLIQAPSNDTKWKGRYLDETATLPADAWGNPLHYEFPGSNHPQNDKPDIWSNGPDKQDGTEDDVNNWTIEAQ